MSTAAAALGSINIYPDKKIDLTDEAGHGYLVATDTITLETNADQTAAVNAGFARIRYRWKEVSLTEYIGIVQAQQ